MLSLLSVADTLRAGDLLFKRHVINDQTDYSAAALIDVNHDGQLDIVCGGDWYEAPTWQKHFIADIPRIGGRPDGFSHLEFDVNRDGWMDVITVNYRSRSIKWMEHPGKGLGPWTQHTAAEPGPMETGRLVDINGDKKLDLLPNGANFAAWWELRWNESVPGSDPAWIRHDLPEHAAGHGMGFGDIDGDGRGDLVGQHGWLSAPTDPRAGDWQWHPDFHIERGSIPMLVVDPDGDGDNDLVWCSAHGFGVYWHEQSQDRAGKRVWTRHAIDTSWSQGHAPLWADMDGDGQAELIAGKRYLAHGGADPGGYDPIVSFRYQFDAATRTWRRWTLSPAGDRVGMGLDPKVADIDGDGDLDLLTSGRSGLYWLENLGPGESPPTAPACPTYKDQPLTIVQSPNGVTQAVETPELWGQRRQHILAAVEKTHGALPDPHARVPLRVTVLSDSSGPSKTSDRQYETRDLAYHASAATQSRATLFTPNHRHVDAAAGFNYPAVVCMLEPGDEDLAEVICTDLATRGFVCIAPGPIEGELAMDLTGLVWQAMRAADVLQACEGVAPERIGFIGNVASGRLGLLLAAHDQRFTAIYSDAVDAGEMLITGEAHQLYSFSELLAAAAPRSLNLAVAGEIQLQPELKQAAEQASEIYRLRKASGRLSLDAPGIALDSKEQIYRLIEEILLSDAKGLSRTPSRTN